MDNKARENKEAGEWAEDKKYYHIAVSRFYYSLYQKLLHINKVKGLQIPEHKGPGCHENFIVDFISKVNSKLSDVECSWITQIGNLRVLRNKHEYKEENFGNDNEYKLSFKYIYLEVDNVLMSLLKKGDKK